MADRAQLPDSAPAMRLEAATWRAAMDLFHRALVEHREELDSLNVFPVPDGDTGTNMLLTQRAVVDALSNLRPDASGHADAVAETVARASLMAARGNSGVILAQVLRVLGGALDDAGGTGPAGRRLADALGRAHAEAARAVSEPQEGTVLTVLRHAADAAGRAASDGGGLPTVTTEALRAARAALALTPDLMPELARAGVVDAGGLGIVLLLDAVRASTTDGVLSVPVGPLGPVGRPAAPTDGHALGDTGASDGAFDDGFEVQFVLRSPAERAASLRSALSAVGTSVTIAGEPGAYAVHVHTDDPDGALAAGRAVGTIQHETVRSLMGGSGGEPRAEQVDEGPRTGVRTGLVAVANGDGLRRTFRSLGALVVRGGPGANPSVGTLIAALQAAGDGRVGVVVLPNHPNVAPAARAAVATASDVDALVLEADSVPAGLAAAAAYLPSLDPAANARVMTEAAATVVAAEVARAAVTVETAAGPVRAGQWIGARRDVVLEIGDDASAVAIGLVARLAREASDPEVITVVLGEGAGTDAPDVDPVVAALRGANPDLRVDPVVGGQPRHRYLIGIE